MKRGCLRVVVEHSTEMKDLALDGLRFDRGARPHGVEELAVRHELTGALDEMIQDAVFGGRKEDALVLAEALRRHRHWFTGSSTNGGNSFIDGSFIAVGRSPRNCRSHSEGRAMYSSRRTRTSGESRHARATTQTAKRSFVHRFHSRPSVACVASYTPARARAARGRSYVSVGRVATGEGAGATESPWPSGTL